MLPLIPGYAGFISRVSLAAAKRQVILTSLVFMLGFALVFVALGASATIVGEFLTQRLSIFEKIAGVVVIVFALLKSTGPVPALPVGMAFAFGWTPAIGPTLAAILAAASQQDSARRGIVQLAVYSIGLAIPFLLTALTIDRFFAAYSKIRRYAHAIEIVSAALMIVTGVLIFSNRFTIVAQWLSEIFVATSY